MKYEQSVPTPPVPNVFDVVEYASAQNSALREAVKNPVSAITEWMMDRYPNLEASHVTAAGTLGCLAVAIVSSSAPSTARAGSWGHLVGSLSDALDGPIARTRATQRGTETSIKGALFDTGCDRVQEFSAGLAQSRIAKARGDTAGGRAQLAFAASSALPSLARSIAESKGVVVSEGALGNRHTRVTLNCLGYFWNKHPERVRAIGAVGTALNVYNAAQRLSALRQDSKLQKGIIDPTKQVEAKTRRNVLAGMAASFGVIAALEASRT